MIRRLWDVTLTVSDLKKAADFYGEILGLTKKYAFEDYVGFDCGGIEIGLKSWGKIEKPREGEPMLNFLVDDVDASYENMNEKGVRFVQEPQNTVWGSRIAIFSDPEGNTLQLTQVDWEKYFSACASK